MKPEHSKTHTTKRPISKLVIRSLCGILMMFLFTIFIRLNKAYIIGLVYIIKALSIREILCILNDGLKIKGKKMKAINWYFLVVTDLYLLGPKVLTSYDKIFSSFTKDRYIFYIFSLYTAGLILFIVNLKRKELKNQFAYFALSHLLIYILSLAMKFCVININNGLFWFVYPVFLVVSNDTFAFIIGKIFGKTKLISLSPNKTVEGFIGGIVGTVFVGFLFIYLRQVYKFIPDAYDLLLNEKRCINIFRYTVCCSNLQIHALFYILFASLIAPFGGFFASALKRAFRVKDFGSVIPGHGGFTDRMDCQFLMGLFSYFYHYTFIRKRIVTKEMLLIAIKKNLTKMEIAELILMLYNET